MIDGDLIKKKIREYDNNIWVRDLGNLSDRDLYKNNKKSIGGSVGYDNSDESELLFRARSNTMGLNDFNRHKGGEVRCELCDADWEDLEHFLLECPKLGVCRDSVFLNEVGGLGDNREKLGNLLFSGNRIEEVKTWLGKLWRERRFQLDRNHWNHKRSRYRTRAGRVAKVGPRGRRGRR